MKKHHINKTKTPVLLFYYAQGNKTYAIPKDIADQYLVSTNHAKEDVVSAEVVFKELEQELTRAGTLLKGTRIREGLSQIEFAKKIKTTQANLSNMENGRRPIGKILAKRIEKAFGVNYRYFLE